MISPQSAHVLYLSSLISVCSDLGPCHFLSSDIQDLGEFLSPSPGSAKRQLREGACAAASQMLTGASCALTHPQLSTQKLPLPSDSGQETF